MLNDQAQMALEQRRRRDAERQARCRARKRALQGPPAPSQPAAHRHRPQAARPAPSGPAKPGQPSKGVGRRALLLARLGGSTAQVGSILLDHYNLKTGRCDPSVGRLARLCGRSERTVRRALAALDAAGLIVRVRHGGFGHRNAFRPAWDKLWALVAAHDAGTLLAGLPVPEAAKSVTCDTDKNVRQTQGRTKIYTSYRGERSARAEFERRQIPMLLPLAGGLARAETAREAAKSRWWRDFVAMAQASGRHMALLEAVTGLDGSAHEAIDSAELVRRGQGMLEAMRQIDLAQLRAIGARAPAVPGQGMGVAVAR